MARLYGHDVAAGFARNNAGNSYPEGPKLALGTWTQRADERYFGAKIPDEVKSVEFVFVEGSNGDHPSCSYERHEGEPLKKESDLEASTSNHRAAYLLSQRAAVLP
jgi:hypothetical protein